LLDQAPRKFSVGFAVYEASPLPVEYIRGIQRVDELWVPSEFCRALFSVHHPRVRVVPHVVARSPAIDRSVCDALPLRPNARRLLHVGRFADRRKGTKQLLRVFEALRGEDKNVELLVKSSPQDKPVQQDGVVQIRQTLSDAQITALYASSQIYVSPHSGEGWGLTLSDALLFGRRAVATAWSGNLDFMVQPDGSPSPLSILVPARVEPIRPPDRYGFFRADQQWAYPSDDDLLSALRYALSLPPPSERELAAEQINLARFSRAAVSELVQTCLASWPARPGLRP
jgi:glycosyltransferase involved in cell wall biosynthesis